MADIETFPAVLAVLIAVFGTARVTRVLAYDDFPPAEWLRAQTLARLGEKWGKILTCIWCTQPYVVLVAVAWAYFSDLHWSWWAFWTWMALSQAGSTLLSYDEPE